MFPVYLKVPASFMHNIPHPRLHFLVRPCYFVPPRSKVLEESVCTQGDFPGLQIGFDELGLGCVPGTLVRNHIYSLRAVTFVAEHLTGMVL